MDIERRTSWNIKILQLFAEVFNQQPYLRYSQAMDIIKSDFKDDDFFYEEPENTYKRLEEYFVYKKWITR